MVHKQEIGLLWSSESFEGKYDIKFGIPIKFLSKKKKLLKLIQKQRNYALIKNAKIVMFKTAYGSPGIDYRVALLFTRYLTAI